MARSMLVTEIFIRATQVRIGTSDDAAALTLMSTDIERIKFGLRTLHEVWAGLVQAALAAWMLYNRLGVVFVAPIGAVIVCFLGIGILINFIGDAQRAWVAGIQKRVDLTATVIKNGKFGWEADRSVLRDVNTRIFKSSLTIVIEPVGSAKSTFCKTLLGEFPFSEGSVILNTRFPHVGFCDQTAFLSNGSIRDNIVGFSPFNDERYIEVIEATALLFDFAALLQGDRTSIGSDGITLSGGKNNAFLSRDLYICSLTCWHLPAADYIIALGDGAVVDQGSFDDLMTSHGYVHVLGLRGSSVSDVLSEKTMPKKTVLESKPQLLHTKPINTATLTPDTDETRQIGDRTVYCGKSSLIALLLKLLYPLPETARNVVIDNTPLHCLDRPALRERIITVPPEAVFLPDGSTFRANLDPSSVSRPEQCQAVLEAVNLWKFVEERGGLDAGMSEGTLSAGQRQLMSLGRASLRRLIRAQIVGRGGGNSDHVILLLDEVSSGVDDERERIIQEIIRAEFKNYTVIAVSHRLDMIMDFDRVAIMDTGEIVEVGNPATLAGQAGTKFGDLVKAGAK